MDSQAAQYLQLVQRSNDKFVNELRVYLTDYLRSLYCFVRGAYLHTAPETLCKFDRLNTSLDSLITTLLTQFPRLCHTGGFCLTATSAQSYKSKSKKD